MESYKYLEELQRLVALSDGFPPAHQIDSKNSRNRTLSLDEAVIHIVAAHLNSIRTKGFKPENYALPLNFRAEDLIHDLEKTGASILAGKEYLTSIGITHPTYGDYLNHLQEIAEYQGEQEDNQT